MLKYAVIVGHDVSDQDVKLFDELEKAKAEFEIVKMWIRFNNNYIKDEPLEGGILEAQVDSENRIYDIEVVLDWFREEKVDE